MKLRAELAGEIHQLSVEREGARVFAEIDGREYEIEAHEAEPGVLLLIRDGRVYECHMQEGASVGASEVRVGRTSYQVSLADPKRLRGARVAGRHDTGRAQVVAPMPGKVVRVLVEQGEAVETGQPIVVVEAMKMQNELKSPKAGTVVELHARVGETVNSGTVLAIIE